MAAIVLSGALGRAGEGAFPEPYDSEPEAGDGPPAAAEALGLIDLPEGFRATVFAAEPQVRNPIAMAWDARGRMWVAENFTYAERAKRFDLALRDRVLIFHDADGDGRAESRKVFADNLQLLTSVEVGRGGVWVMCPPRLLFIPDLDGDDIADGPPQVKLDGFEVATSNYHNFANGLRWGPDGWLYGRCGHACPGSVGAPGTPSSERIPIKGGIWRYHPQTGVFEVVSHGTTNPWGHDWDEHGELFFINSVNGHLWHGISGAHFLERAGVSRNPGVFERIDTHADHWHFDTVGDWKASRDGAANAFGGGHAHVGMMIYQGKGWPADFRGRLFTMNLHGRRTNVERLERRGSGYVGRHQSDVFVTGDRWFRGIDIRQGPDGAAYLLDWSDTGECHDSTGVHRSSGRIFRISYGESIAPDLADLVSPDADAVRRLLRRPNVWFERQLRNVAVSIGRRDEIVAALRGAIAGETATVIRLRALWTLYAMGETSRAGLRLLLDDADERLRVWAIRFLTDAQPIDTLMGPRAEAMPTAIPDAEFKKFVKIATADPSALVRLALASSLQRLPFAQRAELGTALASRDEDAADHNLPAMVWYGLMPLGEADPMALVRIAENCRWPQTLRWIARSLAGRVAEDSVPLEALLDLAAKSAPAVRVSLLRGIGDAFKGWRKVPMPAAWESLLASLPEAPDPVVVELVRELSVLFGDGRALDAIRAIALDKTLDPAARKSALATLIENRPDDLRKICEALLLDRDLGALAVRGLAVFDDPALGHRLAMRYQYLPSAERSGLIEVLASRPAWAATMLDNMRAGKIPRDGLSAFQARQIRAFGDEKLNAKLAEVWGQVRESAVGKRELIAGWLGKLTPDFLAAADLGKGRQLFAAVCGTEGGAIGPDLTGSGRSDIGYLLENILDPSAVLSIDYQMSVLTLADGRILTGVVAREDEKTLTLRQITAEVTVEKGEISKRHTSPASMMPDGLLLAMSPEQVRDLIAYLQHPQQVP